MKGEGDVTEKLDLSGQGGRVWCLVGSTSLVLGSLAAWASFVCLMFSTIFLMKAWLLFSFLAMMISRTNHRALRSGGREGRGADGSQTAFRVHNNENNDRDTTYSLISFSCSMS